MNPKLVIAFICGALMASGIVFMAVRPRAAPKVAELPKLAELKTVRPKPSTSVVVTRRIPDPPPPAPDRTPKLPERVHIAEAKRTAPPSVLPGREKPSPMPPLTVVRQEMHAEVAQVQKSAPPPEPVRQTPTVPPYQPPPAEPESEVPHTVTIAVGTILPVRIGETISTRRNQVGDSFLATLDQPLVVDGFVIAERGSRVEGRVLGIDESVLSIVLVKLNTSDGQHVRIRTQPYKRDASSSRANDIATIAAGAAVGAAVGAAAGGGKGAAIGAAAGGAAGAGGVLLTRNRWEIPVETRVNFRLQDPVTLTERLN